MVVDKTLDCIVCGSCVVDVLVRPVDLHEPIGAGILKLTQPFEVVTGGIVSNSGAAMARLGMRTAAFSLVGPDPWAEIIRARYIAEGIDAAQLATRAGQSTSTTIVMIDDQGERSFFHSVGAPKELDKGAFFSQLDFFQQSRSMLLGYYPLFPKLLPDLPDLLRELRQRDCLTALDAAGDGGDLEPLAPSLPHLDVYCPSYSEAVHQTGKTDPREILSAFRQAGAARLIGVKLGRRGALLSPKPGEWIEIAPVTPPGPVVDSTGAGDAFFGGLLTGILRGLSPADAGRLAAATGACCVTGLGASAGLRDYATTSALANA